jgi:hypothetical protein
MSDWILPSEKGARSRVKKRVKKIKSTGKIKAGIRCPACHDIIFSLYQHDFRRCMCGKVFIDGGDDYMRYGAEQPVEPQHIQSVYRPAREAERLMSNAVRGCLPMAPPPRSYSTRRDRFQFVWHWDSWSLPANLGPYPKTGKFSGAIYRWAFVIGPLEIRRWEDSSGRYN